MNKSKTSSRSGTKAKRVRKATTAASERAMSHAKKNEWTVTHLWGAVTLSRQISQKECDRLFDSRSRSHVLELLDLQGGGPVRHDQIVFDSLACAIGLAGRVLEDLGTKNTDVGVVGIRPATIEEKRIAAAHK